MAGLGVPGDAHIVQHLVLKKADQAVGVAQAGRVGVGGELALHKVAAPERAEQGGANAAHGEDNRHAGEAHAHAEDPAQEAPDVQAQQQKDDHKEAEQQHEGAVSDPLEHTQQPIGEQEAAGQREPENSAADSAIEAVVVAELVGEHACQSLVRKQLAVDIQGAPGDEGVEPLAIYGEDIAGDRDATGARAGQRRVEPSLLPRRERAPANLEPGKQVPPWQPGQSCERVERRVEPGDDTCGNAHLTPEDQARKPCHQREAHKHTEALQREGEQIQDNTAHWQLRRECKMQNVAACTRRSSEYS